MVDFNTLNELYNCLDLYIVSSRFEGGPRSIVECGFTKTPIISTDVGIASEFLSSKSIFDMNNVDTVLECVSDTAWNYDKAMEYSIANHMKRFTETVFG